MSRSACGRVLGSGLMAAILLGPLPASAQFYGGYYGRTPYNMPQPPLGYYDPDSPYPAPRRISADRVVERLEDMGYEDVGRPRFTGTLYIVEATTRHGMRLRIVVDAVRGIVLDRAALGPARALERSREALRRGYPLENDDDGDDEEDGDRRRYSATPDPFLDGLPERGPAARVPSPGSRPVARPADPRLAPGEPAGRPFEGRSGPVYGTNPEAAPQKKKPVQQARRPNNPTAGQGAVQGSPAAPRPPASSEKALEPPAKPKPTAEVRPPRRPVRVIEGVTPLNSGGASSPAGQLDNLPQPPPTPQPSID